MLATDIDAATLAALAPLVSAFDVVEPGTLGAGLMAGATSPALMASLAVGGGAGGGLHAAPGTALRLGGGAVATGLTGAGLMGSTSPSLLLGAGHAIPVLELLLYPNTVIPITIFS